MKRRQALFGMLGLGVGAVSPRHAIAQSAAKPVIGLLDAGGDRLEWWAALRQQLGKLGYIEGQNVAIEARYAGGKYETLPKLARELVQLKVAVIVTGGTVAAQAARRATSAIPVVMASGSDPVGIGLAASLARPGGNVTGVTSINSELNGKRVELLREVLPKMSRLAVLWHRINPPSEVAVRDIEAAARLSKVAPQSFPVASTEEFAGAFVAMKRERAHATIVVTSPFFSAERKRLGDLALEHKMPSMHGTSDFVDAGGMLSYAPSYPELFRHAAVYVDKILKGAKPGDLPIEQPTKFELVINMKTARALGVKIPSAVLFRAERVIE